MSYIIRDARGNALGMLPDSLRAVGQAVERHSPAGSRSAAITAGQSYAVPPYAVGGAQLEVYLDGVACAAGQEYAESGEPGTLSSAIVWNIPIATDRDILVRSK